YMDKSKELWINSCGMYMLVSKKKLPTFRGKGRLDYQLIYIHSGCGVFDFGDDKERSISAGNIVIYRPNEMQKYTYYGKDKPVVYWIHFTGNNISALFENYGIDLVKQVIPVGCSAEYVQLFNKIILELQLKRDNYAECSMLLFKQLLIAMGRATINNEHSSIVTDKLSIESATNYFHEHFHDQILIDKYLEEKNINANAFFKKFKAYTGVSPLQYLLDIRLSNAKSLLASTEYTISEISSIVGYDNPLYFSRLFHKHIGMSPREYRKRSGLST
nr:helix-turn-helix domain-containing protein [Clostridia bacterium]